MELIDFLFAIEILIIVFIVYMQINSFIKTRKALNGFSNDIRKAFSGLKLSHIRYRTEDLNDSVILDDIIRCNEYLEDSDDEEGKINHDETIELIGSQILQSDEPNDFKNVILSTNSYLVKNKGVASDFSIIQDICERRVETTDERISESLSTPLFLGLGGTFMGIICGVISLYLNGGADTNVLFIDVAIAMLASFLGLMLMLWNKVIIYPRISSKVTEYKNIYYDFIQRELMPALSLGVAGTLASFKDVLGSFISKFGSNISGYAETAKLMNKNLESEYLVLQEINNLNITKASKTIADSFATLKESSEELKQFKEYQESLNHTIERVTSVTDRMEGIMATFEHFISVLNQVASQAVETNELQRQFKESLEKHFPTIQDHEALWRQQLDEIGEDARRSSEELQSHLANVTQHIKNFVGDNATFITSVIDMKEALAASRSSAEHQDELFASYKESMDCLKESIDKLYDREGDNQKSLTLALKAILEKNTNPEYIAKLAEINDALSKLQEGRLEILDETRNTLQEIRKTVEIQQVDTSHSENSDNK